MNEPRVLELPTNVMERIRKYQTQGLTGQIKLNFNSGRIESYESMEHTRIVKSMN